MTKNEKTKMALKAKIETQEDFIYCPRLGNSIENLIDVYPNGISDDRIAKVLLTTPQEVKRLFNGAVEKIRAILNIKTKDKS